jgi:hypothetical protein
MTTTARRIALGAGVNLESAIEDLCINLAADSYRLISTFIYGTDLLLIFQK